MKGKSGEDVFGLFESIALAGAGQSFSPSDSLGVMNARVTIT